jgi:NAD(P)-dependent dehydrogenase (short-subunit alcohol dehydrogenase family)
VSGKVNLLTLDAAVALQGMVVACCRRPEQAEELLDHIKGLPDPSRIEVLPLDLEDQTSITALGTKLRESYKRIDMLLNVAGLLGDAKTTPGPERSITKMNRDWFEKTLAINLVGPVMLTQELVPLLGQQRRRKRDNNGNACRPTAVVANLSARVGSISDNQIGGWYSYRISKSGLNQATRTMALELARQSVWCVALHPGTTNTDLSKPFQANVKKESLFPVEFTVDQLLSVIDSVHAEHSGGLYDWAGKSISF